MIHARYIFDKPATIKIGEEKKKQAWLYTQAIPRQGDHVSIFSQLFQVTGIIWMHGLPLGDAYTAQNLPEPFNRGPHDLSLEVVIVNLKYVGDMT